MYQSHEILEDNATTPVKCDPVISSLFTHNNVIHIHLLSSSHSPPIGQIGIVQYFNVIPRSPSSKAGPLTM